LEAPRKGRFHLSIAYWIAAALLIVSWLTGDHFLPWMSWHSEAPVFLATLLLAWSGTWQVWRAGGLRVVLVPFTALPFLLLLLIVVVQRLFGVAPFTGDVWVVLFYAALCVILLALGYHCASRVTSSPEGSGGEFELLAWTLLVGALLSTGFALAQAFDVWAGAAWLVRMPDLRRPGANLAQPNHLATLQVMGAASLIYLRALRRIGGPTLAIIMLTLCFGLAVTESRAGALGLLFLFGWCAWKPGALRLDGGARGPLLWAVAFCAMFAAWPYLLDSQDLLQYTAQPRVAEANLRLIVWPQLLRAVAMQPWHGWGFHQVAAAQNAAIFRAAGASDAYTYSHNLFLDLVVWLGVPFGVSLGAAGVIYFARQVRAANRLLPAYVVAVVLPLAVHSMFEYPYAYAYLLAPPMFLLGALEGARKSKPLVLGITSVTVALTFVTVAMAWSAVEYLQVEEDFRVARMQSLHIGRVPSGYEEPQVRLFDQLAVLLDDARITPEPNMSEASMRVVRSAALYYPWLATQYRYAVALALNGRRQEAEHQITVIRAIWGDKVYSRIKRQLAEEAANEHPELRELSLP
jgi:hypothetical protein